MSLIVTNVGHFAAMAVLSKLDALHKLHAMFDIEMDTEAVNTFLDANPDVCIALIDSDKKTLTLLTEFADIQDSHGFNVDEALQSLKLYVLPPVAEFKLEFPAYVEPDDLNKLQYLMLSRGYQWLSLPGKLNDLRMARYLYAKFHPKHGRLLTIGQDSETSARRFESTSLPEIALENLLQ